MRTCSVSLINAQLSARVRKILESAEEDRRGLPKFSNLARESKKSGESINPKKRGVNIEYESCDFESISDLDQLNIVDVVNESPVEKVQNSEDPNETRGIFAGNVPFDCSSTEFVKTFTTFGQVLCYELPVWKNTDKLHGFGFILYKDIESARKALAMNGNLSIKGRTLMLEPSPSFEKKKVSQIY
jgi:RNA recognition motif-containing protein